MNDLDFTFLTEEELFGVIGHNRSAIFSKYGTKAAVTDFSILLGAYVDSYDFSIESDALENRTGYYWTKSLDGDDDLLLVDSSGNKDWNYFRDRTCCARLVIPYSRICYYSKREKVNEYFVRELEFGEYPQTIVDKNYSRELEKACTNGTIKKTGKYYTTDSVFYNDEDIKFKSRTHAEYEYNGSKYILFVGDKNCADYKLSDGRIIKKDNPYWVKVEPITWLIDEKEDIAVTKKLLFAGVQFKWNEVYNGNFYDTDIKSFIDKYFSKEIVQNWDIEKSINSKTNLKSNPYNFTLDDVSEEDIIEGSIESDIPVFLHGPSSEGKSARVLEIDRDATIIYLANENPDTINGKSVYNEKNNEMIDIKPSWLVKLEEKCKDGKQHILFFDEITNTFPRVQGIVFNIILNKEVNGKWKLPDNARIVAAGNEMEDSLSANELSEPLFNRFSHVYIKTTTESWLKWASVHNIHPAIYSFIAYKNGSVLRSRYDGKKVNADPRKWEMASKMLYKTNNPAMLRSLVGEDITKEFLAFCASRVITLEDVLTDNYSNEDIESLNTAEKYATVMGLSMVDESNIRKIREFIKNMNSELLKVFDNLWANTENRLEILNEIELEETKGIKKK